MGKMISSILLSTIITLLIMTSCCLSKNNIAVGCVPGERKALMMFKASFSDFDPSNNRLSSWKANTQCCSWEGVECDNATGHVVGLHLRNSDDGDPRSNSSSRLRSDTIDSSLLELKYLSYLDLSGNDFNGSSIPTFLGSMKHLQYLNLSNAYFTGVVPHQLGNLSSLHALSLGGVLNQYLFVDDVTTWAGNLPSLEYLDMSYLFLSRTKDLIKVLTTLHSLIDLRLSDTELGENSSISFLHNMSSLSFLDLSDNSLHQKADRISDFLGDKCHLKSLNLEDNRFYGDISGAFKNLSSGCWGLNLESLDLGHNELDGHLPEELGHELKQLTLLDVSINQLSGDIPSSIGNLRALISMDLSENQLGGEIPVSLGQLSNLESIDISLNNFSGHIPSSLGNLRALRVLCLHSNQLGGDIPISLLGQLSNLERIDMHNNSFQGTLSEAHFANLSRLRDLIIGSNNGIKFKVGDDWVPPFQLHTLKMRSVEIIGSGQFPQWLIQTQKSLQFLDLRNCSIKGKLPAAWLGSLKNLINLYLSNNHFEGPMVPELPSSLTSLDLSRNFISGSIPKSLMCQMKGLKFLDLSRNHLSGRLPDCNWGNLFAAILSYNQLSGPIPNSIGGGDYCNWGNLGAVVLSYNQLWAPIPNYVDGGARCSLGWLQLNNNNFTGQIPFSLNNCTPLSFLDIGDNMLSGKLPIGNYVEDLTFLRLRNNQFDGDIPSSYCKFSGQIMDLAHNRLTGSIPRCFGNLSGMIDIAADDIDVFSSVNEVMKGAFLEYTKTLQYLVNLDLSSNLLFGEIPLELTNLTSLNGLNLSHNHLRGTIPGEIGDMKSLESFDLSSNSLSGTIPHSLSKLTSLSYLNLSNNDLSGPIPTGPQLQTFNNPSSYDGNPGLCGDPLPKKCHTSINEIPPQSRKVENDDGDMKDKIYLYAFITCGLATGFWGYFGVLSFKRSWRLALFGHMDTLIGKMLGRY